MDNVKINPCAGTQKAFVGQAARVCKEESGYSFASGSGTAVSGQGYLGKADPLADATKLLELDKEHRSLAADQALMLKMVMPFFSQSLAQLQEGLFRWNARQGFWDQGLEESTNLKKAEKLALMHSELSECLEAIRNSIPEGEKGCESEELADLLIRLLDYCGGFNIDLAGAFQRKQLKNLQRPYRHGKQF